MNTLISAIVALAVSAGGWFGLHEANKQPLSFSGFSDPFVSIQLATSPSNGNCLTTDGTNNAWSASCGSGSGGGGNSKFATTSNNVDITPNGGAATGLIVHSSSTIDQLSVRLGTTTNATSTNLFSGVSSSTNLFTTNLTFGGLTGNSWDDFCVQITGSSDLCDGSDASGAGGSGSVATSTNEVANQVAVFTSNSATPALVGGNSNLTFVSSSGLLTSLSALFTNASTTNFLATGSSTLQNFTGVNATTSEATTTRLAITTLSSELLKVNATGGVLEAIAGTDYEVPVTAGDGLTRTVNDFDCDTASGTVFGCLTSTDWTTFNNKVATTRALTVAGTANQITSSAGSQDLSADRTWTLSIPTDFRVASTTITGQTLLDSLLFNTATGTSATTTNIFSTTASTSNLYLATGGCSGTSALTVSGGKVGCATLSGFSSSTLLANNNTFSGANIFDNITRSTTTSATTTNVFSTTASSTNLYTTNFTFGGLTGAAWSTFCTAITGGAGLCDGNDATGGGGAPDTHFATSTGAFTNAIYPNSGDLNTGIGIGTSTPAHTLTISSSTRPQLALTDASLTSDQWTFRNAGGFLYIATSSPSTFATSTASVLSIDANGFPTFSSLVSGFVKSTNGTLSASTSTLPVPLFGGFTVPDETGSAWIESFAVQATNDNFKHAVYVASSTTAKAGFYGTFHVPKEFNGGTSVIIEFSCPVTTGNIVWDFDYRAIGGDDTESLDQTTFQESLTATKACGSAVNEKQEVTIPLTATNFAADDTVEFLLARDGADAADTGVAGAVIHDANFMYSN